jgi:hypothetical protein
MTKDELDLYFYDRLSVAKLTCHYDPSNPDDSKEFRMWWGMAFHTNEQEEIVFHRIED